MYVVTRSGTQEPVEFDKITTRVRALAEKKPRLAHVAVEQLAQHVVGNLRNGMHTSDIDEYTSNLACSYATDNIEYSVLASRLIIDSHHKNTRTSFREKTQIAYESKNTRGEPNPLVSQQYYDFVMKYADRIQALLDYERDFLIDHFGFVTMRRTYLLHWLRKDVQGGATVLTRVYIERPQDMFMRESINLYMGLDVVDTDTNTSGAASVDASAASARERMWDFISTTYWYVSHKIFTHATPTLAASGTPLPQLSSCFLLTVGDSAESIMHQMQQCAIISKFGGGIGCSLSDLRCNGSHISSTNGQAAGILPVMKLLQEVEHEFNQSGRRPGSASPYIGMEHPDIMGFLETPLPTTIETLRCPDLFPGLWISDLFMERVRIRDSNWSLFDPNSTPHPDATPNVDASHPHSSSGSDAIPNSNAPHSHSGRTINLADYYGDEYRRLYLACEAAGSYVRQVKTLQIWNAILKAKKMTGFPYILFKDRANMMSNQRNLGTIKCSNLCTEIIEYSSPDETAVCNLASICVNQFVRDSYTIHECEELIEAIARDTEHKMNLDELNNAYRGFKWCCAVTPTHDAKRAQLYELYLRHRDCVRALNHEFPVIPWYDWEGLAGVVRLVVRGLNRVIDITFYPTEETRRSNMRHRPIGIGIQGLADAFQKLRIPFDSEEARRLDARIFETMYYNALTSSTSLAKEFRSEVMARGEYTVYSNPRRMVDSVPVDAPVCVDTRGLPRDPAQLAMEKRRRAAAAAEERLRLMYNERVVPVPEPCPHDIGAYPSFRWGTPTGPYARDGELTGSPLSQGKFRWELQQDLLGTTVPLQGNFDWETLREHIKKYGTRNSLLIAPMPTASTASALGNTECFEPVNYNIYRRKTQTGENYVINKYLMHELARLGLWNSELKDKLVLSEGSIQNMGFPEEIRAIYKTVYDMDPLEVIRHAIARQPFIDQSQSLNVYIDEARWSSKLFAEIMFTAWRGGLITGSYYMHFKINAVAQRFSIDPALEGRIREQMRAEKEARMMIRDDTSEEKGCFLCGS